jgi:hypothetical protein
MKFHILVKNHLGSTSTVHVCTECVRKSHLPPLREPGDGSRDPESGLLLAGPVKTYEHPDLRCQNCGAGDAAVGYLRTCAACSRFYLLDHCEAAWPPPPYFCPRPACRKASTENDERARL